MNEFKSLDHFKVLAKEDKLEGVFLNVPDNIYHHKDLPAIGRSQLNTMANRSIDHAKSNQKETPALLMGRAIHSKTLTPKQFLQDFVIAPKINKRTKDGKAEYLQFIDDNKDKTIIDENMMIEVEAISTAVLNHPVASKMLENAITEVTFFWKDEGTGLTCKCRCDAYLPDLQIAVDLKTAINASMGDFRRSIVNYNYDQQGAFYLDGISKATGAKHSTFIFIVVEKSEPHGVAIYNLMDAVIEVGQQIYKTQLTKVANNLKAKINSYPLTVQNIDMPAYGYDVDSRTL